jgi:hypothetical protein
MKPSNQISQAPKNKTKYQKKKFLLFWEKGRKQ